MREEPRDYRRIFRGEDLTYFTVRVKQTDVCIGAVHNLRKQAEESIVKYRQQVEDYIRRQPVFLESLVPIEPQDDAPVIIRHMCQASKSAGVGPMAAIAGAISFYTAKDLLSSSSELVVENGGDIYVAGARERRIGIFAGKSTFTGKIGLILKPEDLPISVCTSSGTVGHSLSFGRADAVVILSRDACLADASATAIGNIVKTTEDIETALEKAQTIQGILGALVIVGERMGAWGCVRLIKL